ncbi:Methionine aminopeptidase, type i, partial [Globisporangium splendens]
MQVLECQLPPPRICSTDSDTTYDALSRAHTVALLRDLEARKSQIETELERVQQELHDRQKRSSTERPFAALPASTRVKSSSSASIALRPSGSSSNFYTIGASDVALSRSSTTEQHAIPHFAAEMKDKVKHVLKTYGRTALLFHSTVFVTTFSGSYAAIHRGVDLRHVMERVPFVDLSKMDPEAGTLALAPNTRKATEKSVVMLLKRLFSSARAPVRAGQVSPRRAVPSHIAHPPYAANGGMSNLKPFIPILDKAQQQKLRTACALARDILAFSKPLVQPGVTTDEIDRIVHEEILRCNAYPSPLNYGGFPKSLCSSVNEIVVHGIPDSRELKDGDIVNIDISVFVDGFHGDTSQTFLVGENVDETGKRLVEVTNKALMGAIEECCKPRNRFSAIGAFIQELVESEGFSVNREYTGHGIGQEFHSLPFILHHQNGEPGYMLPGMAFTVEPAVCEGKPDILHWDDGWTVATVDGKRSAQAEHTVLITHDGVEILT